MWSILTKEDFAFVFAMKQVLEVYKRPIDPHYPVVCMDETHVQCVKEVRARLPGKPERLNVTMSNMSVTVSPT